MATFSKAYFSKYDKLSPMERFFLRTCCYFPPKPRREHQLEDIENIERFSGVYERAFGPVLWDVVKNKTVLDLGCGQGGYVLALANAGAAQVTGVDIQDGFAFAQKLAQSQGYANVSFVQGTTGDFTDNMFDVTVSHDSFEHFEDPRAVLNEMVRVTKRGGYILIKFGPPWGNPWGRHMSGTIRKDRPWIHLVIPERTIMRCHSVIS
ncbi:MAG: class I SAM-dependent methyltransferase [Anaerolineae bacterium]|nr:class I SAM-dependent methyltransferase [Anaerolineae bacterium]